MSDISTFVKRNGSDTDAINKLQALITPLAFPDPEADSLAERVVLSSPTRKRTLTSATGLDLTTVTTETRDRISNSYTVIPDTAAPVAYPVTNTTTGTIVFGESSIIKGGCGGHFTGTQYISIPDNATLESELPVGIKFTFKSDGTQGSLGIYCKKDESTSTNPGIYVELLINAVADFDQTAPNFDSGDFNTTTQASAVRVHISDASGNEVDAAITTATDLFDGSVHTIVINISDTIADFDSGDFENTDFAVTTSGTIEVFVDKVSEGTSSITSVVGSIVNSRSAYVGGRDNGGTIDSKLRGYIALLEVQHHNFTTSEIADYNDKNRVSVTNQLNAIHFCGDESSSVLAEIS